ncbi:hypothetical protein TALC_00102 [Thermoplasmatales archaeon BRNA1]|nr:hypothetical protein TALC_00102 [Thermoplasmatales archaeon BRNA1]
MSLGKQISYNTLGNVASLFGQWLIIMIIPILTDFSEAGVFAVAVSVSSILNQIALFSLTPYQVVDQYKRFSKNDYAVTRFITIVLSFALILPISGIFGYGLNQILIIVAYTIYRNLINYAYLHLSSLQIINHLDYAGKCMILEGMVSFTVFVGCYVLTYNLLLSTLLMALVGGGIFLYLMAYGHKQYLGHGFGLYLKDRGNVRALLLVGTPLLLSTLCPIVITALPKLILENMWNTEIVGIFNTLTSPTIIIPTLVQAVFVPFTVYFARLCRENNFSLLKRQYGKFLLAMASGAVVCYFVSVLFAEPVFVLLYGSEISSYVDYFNILIVGIFFYSLGICGITVLIAKEQGRAAGYSAIVSLIASIAIFFMLIPEHGIDGATWGLFLAYGLFGILITACIYLIPLRMGDVSGTQ